MDMSLQEFEPGVFIEISDTMHGFRKLALVTDSGDMYFDLINADATPFPIYKALEPRSVGNALSWAFEIAEKDKKEHAQFTALQQRLIDSDLDTITVNRALFWAYQNSNYDYIRAAQAGKEATASVVNSRGSMDRLIQKAATA